MTLRILHVTPYAPEAWGYGGIPRLTGTLTRRLAGRGHAVTICATDACDAGSRLGRPPAAHGGVALEIFPNVSNRLAYKYQTFLPIGLSRYLRAHAKTFDVAHLHACRNVPGVLAAHHLSRAGVPYVLAPNGTAPRIERRLAAKRVFDALAGDRILHSAARVLAVSAAESRDFEALGIASGIVRTVPNPVDLDEFAAPIPRGAFRHRFAPGDAPVVLFLGRITPRKRVDLLLRAFARLRHPDARLVIAGNDVSGGDARLSPPDDAGLTPSRCISTGLLTGRARLEALADADVVVYPSEREVFGLVPLEALLCGTPVVVSGDSGCGEVIGGTGGGLVVDAAGADALAAAIDTILDAPGRWREEAGQAAQRVRAWYGPDAVVDRLEQVYREVVH